MQNLFVTIFNFFHTKRWLLFILVALLTITGGYFASKIRLEEDITKMVPSDEMTKNIDFVFSNSKFLERLVINISQADTNADPAPTLLVSYADMLTDSINRCFIPHYISKIIGRISENYMTGVYNIIYNNLPLFLDKNDYKLIDSLITAKSVGLKTSANFKILQSPTGHVMKKYILNDPLGFMPLALKKMESFQIYEDYIIEEGYIFSKDKKHLLLFLIPVNATNETSENSKFLSGLDNLIEVLKKTNNNIHAEYFGAMAVAVDNARQIKKDIALTVSIAVLFLMITISMFYRRKTVFFLLFFPAIFGVIITLAILYLTGNVISSVALGLASALLSNAVDQALHFLTHFRNMKNVRKVIQDLTLPLLMSTTITAIAFFSLILIRVEALHDLGIFAALSVIIASIFTLIVLPHLIQPSRHEKENELQHHTTFIDKLMSFQFDRSKILICIILAGTIIFSFTAGMVEFESDMSKLNFVTEKIRQADKNLLRLGNNSLNSLYLISSGKNLQEALKYNEKATSKIDSLVKAGIINKYSSVSNFIMSDSLQEAKIRIWSSFWTQNKKDRLKHELIASGKKYNFNEKAFSPFYSTLYKNFIPTDFSRLEIVNEMSLNLYIIESQEQTAIVTPVKSSPQKTNLIYSSFGNDSHLTVFDKKSVVLKFIDIVKKDNNDLAWISLLTLVVILILAFGRFELGIITFIPMFVSWVWTVGLMGLFGVKFTIFNIIISSFIIGLSIDYSIFIMQGLLQEYKLGIKTLHSYKTSIFISFLTTFIGIRVLIFARHPALRSIAFLSIMGIFSVVIISYTLIPVLFRFLVEFQRKKRVVPITLLDFIASLIAFVVFFISSLITTLTGTIFFRIIPNKNKNLMFVYRIVFMWIARFVIYIMVSCPKKIINPNRENFKKPSMIICNHQSHIDVLLILMLYPKIIVLINDWVKNNIFYGSAIKYAEFYPISDGYENSLDFLSEKIKDGYSILVFPEGSRSPDGAVKRFHKGAFYLAEKLQLDVLPVVLHGAGNIITKGEPFLKSGRIILKILERIGPASPDYNLPYRERAKLFRKFYINEYHKVVAEYETPEYFRSKLIRNYIYKGPILEWYLRVKLLLGKNYRIFHELLPGAGKITDIGCGYGFMAYMLNFLAPSRKITGVDYDEAKINIARHCISKNDNIVFICFDVVNYDYEKSDAFVLYDVLHYLPENEQKLVISKCIDNLAPNGIIIIRDGNTDLKAKHKRTRYTEFWSTKILGFNKTRNKLCYTSKAKIVEIAAQYNMAVQTVESSHFTSNEIYIIR
ncbi:MAG: 1-acyl-sn-glycerol-3-phosphate acyltransferase [Bacteroidia bacterium]|nr:1-acyl-sn-glycerol-3-phosphate acyltransferase [Bacteroidia bacterium]